MDESGFRNNQIRTTGRSLVGEPAICCVPPRVGNVNFVVCCCENGPIHWRFYAGSANSRFFAVFYQELGKILKLCQPWGLQRRI